MPDAGDQRKMSPALQQAPKRERAHGITALFRKNREEPSTTFSSGSPIGRQPEKVMTTLRNRTDTARCATRHNGRRDVRRDGRQHAIRA